MKFNAKAFMKSNPDFHINGKLDPIAFNTSINGEMNISVDKIKLHISQIPIKVKIPFLKRKSEPKVIGVIGGFNVSVDPFSFKVHGEGVHLNGTIGQKGITGEMDCSVKCSSEGVIKGETVGMKAKINMMLEDDQSDSDKDDDDNHSHHDHRKF
jgi:hypothetical protein